DPLLGPAYSEKQYAENGRDFVPGFVINGDPDADGVLRIVTLGGSTTDGVQDDQSWPQQLHERLAERGVRSVVFNGGVSGYGSAQEMLKLIRDVLPLKPDLVITYDGVNDVAPPPLDVPAPIVHPYLKSIVEHAVRGPDSWILPNLVSLLGRNLYSQPKVELVPSSTPFGSSAESWARNVRIMNAICTEFGIRYLDFLQPVLGVGSYRSSAEEMQRIHKSDSCRKSYSSFYTEARSIADLFDYIVDATDVFVDAKDVYRDFCHVKPAGNYAVSVRIIDNLSRLGWLHARRIARDTSRPSLAVVPAGGL
ncbi:MAG: SGNH/GDSL hydrolase family protein, partial [Deltaproteobacteria bacterium]|nr:SGNH/GDSL hydrolase family protein [Deltaproteobacteria bacterium]